MNVTDSAHNSILTNSIVVTEIDDHHHHHRLTDRNRQKLVTGKAPSPMLHCQYVSPVRTNKKASLDSFLSRRQQRTTTTQHNSFAAVVSPAGAIDKRKVGGGGGAAGGEQQEDDDETERTATETDFNDGSLHGSSWHSLRSSSSSSPSWHSPQRSAPKARLPRPPLRAAPHYQPSWAEDDDAAAAAAAVSFEDLRYHRMLGEGFFGQVWLVSPKPQDGTSTDDNDTNHNSNHKPQHYYALKKLSKYHLLCEDQVENTIREKQLLQQLHHPNIVRFVASHKDPAFLYLLLDYCPGGDLFARLHSGSNDDSNDDNNNILITEAHAQFYTACLADALWYLHCRARIVYRDLKPENVVMDRFGYPVLVDFGYARPLDSDEKAHTLCGTPRYIAPETIAGAGHSFPVDYWALGVVVYELLSGGREHPFEFWDGMDDCSLYGSIAEADYLPLDDGNSGTAVSPEARDFVDRLLVKDPARRLGADENCDRNGVLRHPWLRQQDVPALRRHLVPAPWIPPPQQPPTKDDNETMNETMNETSLTSSTVHKDGDDLLLQLDNSGLIAAGDTKLTKREQQKFADF